MRLRRATREWLDSEPVLYDEVLARICGAWDEGDIPEKPPHPWQVCKQKGISYGALLAWVAEEDAREKKFARAMRIRARLLADQAIEIADTPQHGVETRTRSDGSFYTTDADMLEHRKLQIQARQWAASKLDRATFGDKVEHEVKGGVKVEIVRFSTQTIEEKIVDALPIEQPALPATASPAR